MFFLMVVEWPLITLAGAFLASIGFFDIYIVAILGYFWDLFWDLLFFFICRYGFKIFQKKTEIDTASEKWFVKKLDSLIYENLLLSIFIIKFVPYAPPIGLPYIGRSRVSTKKYILTSLFASLPVPILVAIIGFHIGSISHAIERMHTGEIIIYSLIFAVFIIFSLIAYFFIKKKIAQKIGDISDFTESKKREKKAKK